MRHISVFFMGILALAPMRSQAGTDTTAIRQRKLIWSDEFDAPGTTALDPAKWRYEIGYIRNQEEQYYTDSLKNVFVKDGMLNIVALKNDTYEGLETI